MYVICWFVVTTFICCLAAFFASLVEASQADPVETHKGGFIHGLGLIQVNSHNSPLNKSCHSAMLALTSVWKVIENNWFEWNCRITLIHTLDFWAGPPSPSSVAHRHPLLVFQILRAKRWSRDVGHSSVFGLFEFKSGRCFDVSIIRHEYRLVLPVILCLCACQEKNTKQPNRQSQL